MRMGNILYKVKCSWSSHKPVPIILFSKVRLNRITAIPQLFILLTYRKQSSTWWNRINDNSLLINEHEPWHCHIFWPPYLKTQSAADCIYGCIDIDIDEKTSNDARWKRGFVVHPTFHCACRQIGYSKGHIISIDIVYTLNHIST